MVVALTLSLQFSSIRLSAAGGRWLVTLFTSIAFSLIGLLVPNLYRQSSEGLLRAHNGIKFLNEFLARHLLGYLTYFMALSLTATFIAGWEWTKILMTLVVGITLSFYFFGVYKSTFQDRFFLDHHGCVNAQCRLRIDRRTVWELCWPNALMAISLLMVAVASTLLVQ